MARTGGVVHHLFPGIRVFISGCEVTRHTSSVTVNWNINKAPSTCILEIRNENDRFVMTNRDILTIKGEIDYGSDIVDQQDFMWNSPTNEALSDLGKDDMVEGGILDKTSEKNKVVFEKLDQPFIDLRNGKKKSRYYFVEGQSIFHSGDPVRVFFRDPEEPYEEIDGTMQEKWYYGFAGFISDVTDRVTADKFKSLRIVVEDVKRLLRQQVVSVTPGYMDTTTYDRLKGTIVDPSPYQNYFANLSLERVFEYAVYGDPVIIRPRAVNGAILLEPPVNSANFSDQERGNLGDDYTSKVSTGGEQYEWYAMYTLNEKIRGKDVFMRRSIRSPGKFDPDKIDIRWYGRKDANNSALEDWQKALDCKVKKEDTVYLMLSDYLSEFTREATPTTTTVEAVTRIGENPRLYPIDGGGLKMLLPKGLEELGKDVTEIEFNHFGDAYTRFSTKLDLIYEAADGIDFLFYATPKGDMVVEFPMYDFLPKDYSFFDTEFMDIFTIEDPDLYDFDATESDSEVKTACWVSQSLIRPFVENKKVFKHVEVAEELIPLYGYRAFDGGFDRLLLTPEAVKVWTKICLNRINSEAYSVSPPINFRPGAWIGRPYLWEHRNHIGFVVSISHNYTQKSSVQTTLGMNYMRGWAGKLNKDGEMIYDAIGGVESRPLDYATLFGKKNKAE